MEGERQQRGEDGQGYVCGCVWREEWKQELEFSKHAKNVDMGVRSALGEWSSYK